MLIGENLLRESVLNYFKVSSVKILEINQDGCLYYIEGVEMTRFVVLYEYVCTDDSFMKE